MFQIRSLRVQYLCEYFNSPIIPTTITDLLRLCHTLWTCQVCTQSRNTQQIYKHDFCLFVQCFQLFFFYRDASGFLKWCLFQSATDNFMNILSLDLVYFNILRVTAGYLLWDISPKQFIRAPRFGVCWIRGS